MANNTCAEYATAALVEAAIEALATTVTFELVPYREEGTTKFMIISPCGAPLA